MNERQLISLYFAREERAIEETRAQYSAYCARIARNILSDGRDCEECLSDTWLRAWNAIPPERPLSLRVFLGRITRNLALNRLRSLHAGKRGGGQVPLALDELAECVSGSDGPESDLERAAVLDVLSRFLDGLEPTKRALFIRRYWQLDSVAELADWLGWSQSRVTTVLHRLRGRLRTCLKEEGIEL